MTLAELIMEDASARGLRHYFGLPGGGFPLDLLEAARQRGVELVSVAHESSAAIVAGYYGHFKKTAGIAISIKGVGAGNLVGGALNAFMERMPLVCLCEAAPTVTAGFDLAQTCDQSGLFRPAVKFQATLTECGVEDTLNRAVTIAIDGRPGPTAIHLPADLSQLECGEPKPVEPSSAEEPPDEANLEALRERIGKASRPLIIAGSDILRAGADGELRRLAENIEAAVLVGMDAKGVLPELSGRFAGIFTGHSGTTFEAAFLKRADLVIVVGMDPLMREALWYSPTTTCELVARESYRSFSPNPEIRVDGNLKFSLKWLAGLVQPGFSTGEITAVRKPVMRLFERPTGGAVCLPGHSRSDPRDTACPGCSLFGNGGPCAGFGRVVAGGPSECLLWNDGWEDHGTDASGHSGGETGPTRAGDDRYRSRWQSADAAG